MMNRGQLAAIAAKFGKNITQLPTGEAQLEAVGKRVQEALTKPLTVPLAATAGAPGMCMILIMIRRLVPHSCSSLMYNVYRWSNH
jgi:hypothetical protein